ncbi:MAG: cyclic nucleotide-binding domain-containing protein [Hyphomicrobiaceae bacterium]
MTIPRGDSYLLEGIEMRPAEIEETRKLRIFDGVGEKHLLDMLRPAFLQRFPAGVELVREGDPADFLHVVVEGKVEVFSAYRDRETTVSVLGPGQCFIMAAVVLDRVYLKSARSLTPARILLLPADVVRRVFSDDAAFARCLASDLAASYRMLVKELKNQKLRTGLERLANWLLAHREEMGGANRFELPFEKKVLASRLGMAPEVLSRTFASLVAYKVKVKGAVIEIGDVPALTKLARPTATIDDPAT